VSLVFTLFPGDATENDFSLRAVLEEGREEEGYETIHKLGQVHSVSLGSIKH
jgi:hypothetical protein